MRLVQRQWSGIATVQPRTPSVFSPVPDEPAAHFDASVMASQADDVSPPVMSSSVRPAEVTTAAKNPPQRDREYFDSAIPRSPTIGPDVERPGLSRAVAVLARDPRPSPSSAVDVPDPSQRPSAFATTTHQPTKTPMAKRSAPPPHARPPLEMRGSLESTVNARVEQLDPAPEPIAPLLPIHQDSQRVSAPRSLLASVASPDRSQYEAHSAEPPIQVTIGRIEVTALTSPAAQKRAPAQRKTAVSLRDHLSRRRGRKP